MKQKSIQKVKPVLPVSQVTKLVLFDHDGTMCDTNPMAYDSIKQAYQNSLDAMKIPTQNHVDWDKVFADTTGTTEKNLVRYLSYFHNVPINLLDDFENKFYHFRAKWYQTMRDCNEYIWDSYFPDAHQLAYECRKRREIAQWILTGNPEIVTQERLTNSLRDIFSNESGKLLGVFGNEDYTRTNLLKIAIARAEVQFGKPILAKNKQGFYQNIYYIADSRNDFFSGLEAGIRMVWIPSRKLQDIIAIRNQDFVKFILKTVGDNVLITNDLSSKEVRNYILG